jgi:hypothetical protein
VKRRWYWLEMWPLYLMLGFMLTLFSVMGVVGTIGLLKGYGFLA